MIQLFAAPSKFCKLDKNNTLTQLTTLQNYLRTIYNRGEINDDEYNSIRPQSTKPTRTHGLPKTHKPYDNLPPLRPIIDTTGNTYQPVTKFLSRLLNPLTHNEYSLQESFDAVKRIQNIPDNYTDGYRFISFDVKSSFTSIPLKETVEIILNKIYEEKMITTTLKKRTMKKLLLDACTKTQFFINGNLYKQIGGVSTGSPLSPTLANIIMIATSDGTSVFRKKTHTGQYVHLSIVSLHAHGHTKLPGLDRLSTEHTKFVVTIAYYRMKF